jgi:hypothetical protein
MKKTNLVLGNMLIMLLAFCTGLTAQGTVPIDTDEDGKLEINDKNNLLYLSQNSSANWAADYEQTADINFVTGDFENGGDFYNSGAGFSPIGNSTTKFTGSYDGDGHTIDNLYINRSSTDYQGFFGYVQGDVSTTEIQQLGLTNIDITGRNHSGGLVAYNSSNSTISNCYCTGSISGEYQVGGLIGEGYSYTTINNCFSEGSVSGTYEVGGLIGYHRTYGSINNSYSHSDVTRISGTNTSFGGFCGGIHYSTVENCYSTGDVFSSSGVAWNVDGKKDKGFVGYLGSGYTFNNNFFDSEASNQTYDNADYLTITTATAKTTENMTTDALVYNYTTNIYLAAGWDFKGETGNGSDDIWNIGNSRNDGYPYLDWEHPSDPGTLPVVLSAFTAQFIENTPTLYWETQSETDNMGWFVSRNEENNFTTSEVISEFIEGYGTTSQQQSYLYEDQIENPEIGDTYYYWLESIDYSGIINHYDKVAILTIPDNGNSSGNLVPIPERFGLLQNEPNPVINSTRIAFNLTETAQVDLAIYNLKGQLIKKLYSGVTSKHTVMWDGKDEQGKELENGVYLYRLRVNGKTEETKKLIIMK